MTIRKFDFIVGPETSTQPTVVNASASDDVATYGQIQDEFTSLSSYANSVVNVTALKALDSSATSRVDNQIIFVVGIATFYKWDSGNATAGDNDLIVTPDDITEPAPGRWLKIALTAGGGAAGSGAGLEQVVEKTQQETQRIATERLPKSAQDSFERAKVKHSHSLLEDYPGSGTSLGIVIDPLFLDTSDKQTDSTAGWSIGGDASNITTSATHKTGTLSISFDKDATGAYGFICKTPTTQVISENTELYFWVNMPSVTNLIDITVYVGQNGTDNSGFSETTDHAGSAISTGWNLFKVDLTRTADVVNGAGFNLNSAIGFFCIGATTSPSTQTYAGILIDAFFFGTNRKTNVKEGDELTILNASNIENFTIDVASTNYQGLVTITSAMSNSYAAEDATFVGRGVMNVAGDGFARAQTGLSGNALNTQNIRRQIVMPVDITSTDLEAFVELDTNQFGTVAVINTNVSIEIEAPDFSADWLNGDEVIVLQVYGSEELKSYVERTTRTMNGNATYGAGKVTVPMADTSTIEIGDLVFRNSVSAYSSLVAKDGNEVFSAMDRSRLEVIGNILQAPDGLTNYYKPGDSVSVNMKDLVGTFDMPINGTIFRGRGKVNLNSVTSGFSGVNNYAPSLLTFGGQDFSVNFWFKWDVTNPGVAVIAGAKNSTVSSEGWVLKTTGTAGQLEYRATSSSQQTITGTYDDSIWRMFTVTYEQGTGNSRLYINAGTALHTLTQTISSSTGGFRLGVHGDSTNYWTTNGLSIDHVMIFQGKQLGEPEIADIYNGGFPEPIDNFTVKQRFAKTGQGGQKLSLKAEIDRNTDTDPMAFRGIGIIAP